MHMHRRNKSNALAPPRPPSTPSPSPWRMSFNAHDLEKPPSPRSRSLPNRISVIFLAILSIIVLAHFVLPSVTSLHSPFTSSNAEKNKDDVNAPYTNRHLKPKNYLNFSAGILDNPFEFCPTNGVGDELLRKYGAGLMSSTRLHVGSSARVQRVLAKAMAGQPITISVIGGSVSACHGSGDDPISPRCYPSLFFQSFNQLFPHPLSELTNGAIRLSASSYYAYCSSNHIPDLTDLIIVELDTSDTPDKEATSHFEVLIRSLLLREDSPAVILLGHFSPQTYEAYGGAFGPDTSHAAVARFYDVPHISTRGLLYEKYMKDPKSLERYYADPVLANEKGHEVLRDVLVGFMQSQVCDVWERVISGFFGSGDSSQNGGQGGVGGGAGAGLFGGVGQRKGVPEPGKQHVEPQGDVEVDAEGNRIKLGLPDSNPNPIPNPNALHPKPHTNLIGGSGLISLLQSIPIPAVPSVRMNTRASEAKKFEELKPFCAGANDLVNPLPGSIFDGSGWGVFHPSGGGGGASMSTRSHYWYSTISGSKLRIPIQVGAGDVGVYYMFYPGTPTGSELECWVDDNHGGRKRIRNYPYPPPKEEGGGGEEMKLEIIDHFVTRGSHFVECQLMGDDEDGAGKGKGGKGGMFKVMGVFST